MQLNRSACRKHSQIQSESFFPKYYPEHLWGKIDKNDQVSANYDNFKKVKSESAVSDISIPKKKPNPAI